HGDSTIFQKEASLLHRTRRGCLPDSCACP
ncbi:MAG: hypothetical protein AMXMBFR75_27840, partial [Candidatus Hinthialibacteria bacterium]